MASRSLRAVTTLRSSAATSDSCRCLRSPSSSTPSDSSWAAIEPRPRRRIQPSLRPWPGLPLSDTLVGSGSSSGLSLPEESLDWSSARPANGIPAPLFMCPAASSLSAGRAEGAVGERSKPLWVPRACPAPAPADRGSINSSNSNSGSGSSGFSLCLWLCLLLPVPVSLSGFGLGFRCTGTSWGAWNPEASRAGLLDTRGLRFGGLAPLYD